MEYLNFSWILEGSLAASRGPTNRRDLIFLKMRDIASVIRMEEQTISAEALEMRDLFEPVPDFTAPTLEQIERMVLWMEQEIETWERPVVVTCAAGLGRTGTVLACYFVYCGYTPEAAIKLIRTLRPGSIQTPEQEEAVSNFSQLLKSRERERRRRALEALQDF